MPVLAPGCKSPPSRAKTDEIHLLNGDRLTGEIKKLEQGKVRLKTTALDTVYVEWDKIAKFVSTYEFEFLDVDGERRFGRVVNVSPDTLQIVDAEGQSTVLLMADIVEITPINESFLSRLDGSISLGFNYSKGSDVAQLDIGAELKQRTRQVYTELDLSSSTTVDAQEEATSRDTLTLTHNRYRERWFSWFQGSLEKNDSLGIDLRSLIAAGGGRSLISDSDSLLEVGVGLAFSEENTADSTSSRELEGVVRAAYSIFRFTGREVDSDYALVLYPGISDSGHLRGEFDASLRREIFKDVYLELSGYYTFDNEPPTGGEQTDFGVNTSLGWSF